MDKEYSIAAARNNLSDIVHAVETGKPVKLTRRGKLVAVLVSEREFKRLAGQQKDFWAALQAFRKEANLEELGIGPGVFEDICETGAGRDVTL